MMKYFIKAAWLFAIGLFISFLVSTVCAIWLRAHHVDDITNGRTTQDDSGWAVRIWKRPGLLYARGYPIADVKSTWKGGLEQEVELSLLAGIGGFHETLPPAPDLRRTRIVVARGWPMLATWMQGDSYSHRTNINIGQDTQYKGGLVSERAPNVEDILGVESDLDKVLIPMRPIWFGLIGNSIFYAALAGLLVWLRKRITQRIVVLTERNVLAITTICVCLGFGTTVGVIVICTAYAAVSYAHSTLGETNFEPGPTTWHVMRLETAGALRLTSSWYANGINIIGGGPSGAAGELVPSWAHHYLAERGIDNVERHADARGWPMLAAWGGFEESRIADEGGFYVSQLGPTRHALVMPTFVDGKFIADSTRVIPLWPIWSGLVGNTLFYAALWFVVMILFLGPRIVLRSLRHAKGRCGYCGYDLHGTGSDRCSECGRRRIKQMAQNANECL